MLSSTVVNISKHYQLYRTGHIRFLNIQIHEYKNTVVYILEIVHESLVVIEWSKYEYCQEKCE